MWHAHGIAPAPWIAQEASSSFQKPFLLCLAVHPPVFSVLFNDPSYINHFVTFFQAYHFIDPNHLKKRSESIAFRDILNCKTMTGQGGSYILLILLAQVLDRQ